MLKKTINIDGKDVEFKASAAVPRIYRLMFGRDIFRDMTRMARNLKKEQKKAQEESGETEGSELPIEDLEMFENVAYVMAVSYTHLDVYKRQQFGSGRNVKEKWRTKGVIRDEQRNPLANRAGPV